MTNPTTEILTKKEFKHALGMIIKSATINGIDIRGSWLYRNKDNDNDWEVMVVELEQENAD